MLLSGALVLLSFAAQGDDSSSTASLLPRDTIVPVSVVTKYFPDVTKDSGTGPNETSVGKVGAEMHFGLGARAR